MQFTPYRVLTIVGWVDAGVLVLVGAAELVFAGDSLGRRVLFVAALSLLAALVVGGIRMIEARPWPGAGVASLGAILGGFALFWTGLTILCAVAIVVLSVVCARRVSAVAPASV